MVTIHNLNFAYTGVVAYSRFTYLAVIAVGFGATGCSSSLAEDSLSELPAAKNLDSVAILQKKNKMAAHVSWCRAHSSSAVTVVVPVSAVFFLTWNGIDLRTQNRQNCDYGKENQSWKAKEG